MAARINKKHDQWTRDKIKVTQLVNRLQAAALGTIDPNTGKPLEMTPGQMKAAEVLLKKALPDLSCIEQHNTGEEKTYLVQVPMQSATAEEWQKIATPDKAPGVAKDKLN